jgi:Zn-dependent peptidase ImmA (M78 family)
LGEFLEEQGIKVMQRPLEASVSGMMCHVRRQQDGQVPVIVVNANDNGERQRFTLAHELGHLVLKVHADLDEEKAAHRFAGALLMPAEALRKEVGEHRTAISLGELIQLKRVFGVSVQMIAYRCKDIGILGSAGSGKLFALFTRMGWRKPPYDEPEKMPPEEITRFRRLCFRALAEGLVSEAKAAELLETSVRQLERDMEGPLIASAS